MWKSSQLLFDIDRNMTEPKNIKNPEEGKSPGKRFQIIPGGFAGTGPNGSFFETPEWVDKNKPPGLTSQEKYAPPPGKYIF